MQLRSIKDVGNFVKAAVSIQIVSRSQSMRSKGRNRAAAIKKNSEMRREWKWRLEPLKLHHSYLI